MLSILSNEMTPNCSPLLEVVGHVQVGYGIFDNGHLVEVTELKRIRRPTLTEGRKFKLPVGVLPRYAEKEPQRPRSVNDARHIANKGVT